MTERTTRARPALLEVDASTPRHRSGAVARMLHMPVATLRIWERRYDVVSPATAPSGHRLYCDADVQRLACIKRLTALGHAIGAVAPLGTAELHRLVQTHAQTAGAAPGGREAGGVGPYRLGVVGGAMAHRLRRPELLARLGSQAAVVAVFDSLQAAVEAVQSGLAVDTLVLHLAGLHAGDLAPTQALTDALGDRRLALIYGFAAARTRDAFTATGASLRQDLLDDVELADWLHGLRGPARQGAPLPLPGPAPRIDDGGVAPRRYDDAGLTDFAGSATRVACECPRHVAELLMHLARFEAYSGQCAQANPADARLHAHLARVAGGARMLFEGALEALARHEGLALPTARELP